MQAQKQPVQNLEASLDSSKSADAVVSIEANYSNGSSGAVYTQSDISDILTLAHSIQERVVVNKAVNDLGDRLKTVGFATDAENFDPNKISEEALHTTAEDLGIKLDYVRQATDMLKPSHERIKADIKKHDSKLRYDVLAARVINEYKSAFENVIISQNLKGYVIKLSPLESLYNGTRGHQITLYKKKKSKLPDFLNRSKKLVGHILIDTYISDRGYDPKLNISAFDETFFSLFGEVIEKVYQKYQFSLKKEKTVHTY